MNNRDILFMSVLFVALPAWIGILWVEALNIRGNWERFLHALVLGFSTMLAAAQIVLVPMVAFHAPLTKALAVWKAVILFLALVSFYLVLRRWSERIERGKPMVEIRMFPSESGNGAGGLWTWIFGALLVVFILVQAYIPARYEHRDDDDARFVSEEVSAVEHDTMYWDDPITIDQLYWNEGEVRKDFTSPWAMYIAMCSKMSGIPPAVLSHTYLPFFLILLCYGVYYLIGGALLKGEREKRPPVEKVLVFLLFLSVIHLWGYTSTHTLASMLLLRIWQGKAVCASLMLPLCFYLMYQILQKEYHRCWIVLLYVASNAACLLSGIGIVTVPALLFLYGAIDFCYNRSLKKLLAIWMAAVPCGLYLLYYLIG